MNSCRLNHLNPKRYQSKSRTFLRLHLAHSVACCKHGLEILRVLGSVINSVHQLNTELELRYHLDVLTLSIPDVLDIDALRVILNALCEEGVGCLQLR